MRLMASGALLADRIVNVRSGFDFPSKIIVTSVAVFWFRPSAEKIAIIRLVRLVTDRTVGRCKDGVSIAFPGHSVALCAGLFYRIALQQELGIGRVGLVATGAIFLQWFMLMGLVFGHGVAEGAHLHRTAEDRILVSADVLVVAGVAGAFGNGCVDLRRPGVGGVALGGHAGRTVRQRSGGPRGGRNNGKRNRSGLPGRQIVIRRHAGLISRGRGL